MTEKIITIDGPSGSGKGTISRLIAERLGADLLDSGALYRLTALAAHLSVTDLNNERALASLAESLDIEFRVEGDSTLVFLNEQNVSSLIREESIGMMASQVAAFGKVREALLARQRAFYTQKGLVADGRDMGTVVFPNAPLKVFLTASAEIRASRRVEQLARANVKGDYETILKDIQTRDEQDRTRALAPLVPAQNAVIIDCTEMEIVEVRDEILTHAESFGLR